MTDAELDYFRDLADSSYTNRNMEDSRIPDALDNIPKRFEDWSEDIAFLKQGGKITEEVWEEMLNIDQRAGHVNDVPFSASQEPENKELQLGYEVGSILELLMSESASENDRMNVGRGVILALTGRNRKGVDEDRITALKFANQLAEKHPPKALLTLEEVRNLLDDIGVEDHTENAISEVLKQRGITPGPYLLEILEEEAEETEYQYSVSDTESDIEHTVHKSSVSIAEAESVVDGLLQIYPDLKAFDQLHEPLLEDTQFIDDKMYYSTPVVEVVGQLWDHREKCTLSSINSGITTSTSKSHTKGALSRLSDDHNDELWTNQAVAVGDQKWELTGYGKTISYLLFETGINIYDSDEADLLKESEDDLGIKTGLDFGQGLRDLLHYTVISPTNVDSEFVNSMEEMQRDNGSCVNWRNRVSTVTDQD